MELGISEVARAAGTTSRTLRHYQDVGLLEPSRVGANGYRYYDDAALTRLQRILLLRRLGLGVGAIADALERADDTTALRAHLGGCAPRSSASSGRSAASSAPSRHSRKESRSWLRTVSTASTTRSTKRRSSSAGEGGLRRLRSLVARAVRRRKQGFMQEHRDIAAPGLSFEPLGARGRPGGGCGRGSPPRLDRAGLGRPLPSAEELVGLADMYVADERFAANYGGQEGANYVRDALTAYAVRELVSKPASEPGLRRTRLPGAHGPSDGHAWRRPERRAGRSKWLRHAAHIAPPFLSERVPSN